MTGSAANLFIYTSNNPIMYNDLNGNWAQNMAGFAWVNTNTGLGFQLNIHLYLSILDKIWICFANLQFYDGEANIYFLHTAKYLLNN